MGKISALRDECCNVLQQIITQYSLKAKRRSFPIMPNDLTTEHPEGTEEINKIKIITFPVLCSPSSLWFRTAFVLVCPPGDEKLCTLMHNAINCY
jgi:hypothetical protein